MRAESAVEPTRSENITVTWRRSARSSGRALGALDVVAGSTKGDLSLASLRRAAIASSSFTLCPIDATPSSFRISCVRPGGPMRWLRENGRRNRPFFHFGVLVCGAVTNPIGADMPKGTVKWFNSQKGYGFIQPQGGSKDVFVHISAVERAGLSGLNEGQVVEYEEVSNRGKTSAENLRVQR
jgi:cold shock protein